MSVDLIAVYNPIFETEHYIDGQHNGGVFNSGNLNVYGYCYGNPVVWTDPNGKQNKAIQNVRVHNYTLVYVGAKERWGYTYVNTEHVARNYNSTNNNVNTYYNMEEYKYTIYFGNSSQPLVVSTQNVKDEYKNIVPGLIADLFNPYNIKTYKSMKEAANLFKVLSNSTGKGSSLSS